MAFDAFLKIDGIDGESTDDKHKDNIEVVSYHHALSQAGGAAVSRTGSQTGGRVDISDFTVTKVLDKSSPGLAMHCCTGKHIPKVVLEICSAADDKQTFMKYTMSDVVVSSFRPGGSSNGEGSRPMEEVGFRFAKIEWAYTPIDNTGKPGSALQSGWDAATNKKV